MNLLAFELSTEHCSVALLVDGELQQLAEKGNRPSRRILAMADELLAEAGLRATEMDAIAFGRGPGAFTGLRIAAGVAQGLAFGAELPVVPVSSLAALAQRAAEDRDAAQIVAVLDARMNEIYSGSFRLAANGLVQAAGDEQLLPPAALEIPADGEWIGAGPGWAAYPALANKLPAVFPEIVPDAAAIARLAAVAFASDGGVDAAHAMPVYLRDTVAWKKTAE
ncbi:MAG TPA: tRNA (adenosine(37)-N6)-threonylcarbamoyltransferase complex dimerization subunit type 1 TsaB [Gammaproteobacteria bacterium]